MADGEGGAIHLPRPSALRATASAGPSRAEGDRTARRRRNVFPAALTGRERWVSTRARDDEAVLEIKVGEIYGLRGPNGAGKTTTIRSLVALLRPSRGQARVAGHDLRADRDAVRSVVGLLPESTGFYEWMTPVAYLRFFADLYGMPRAEAFRRIESLLERVGLVEGRSRAITTLSPCGMPAC